MRYPGGKQILGRILAHLIKLNRRTDGIYVEPYCGGAGAALGLLFGELVGRLLLNDADPSIYAFWSSVLHDTDRFVRLINDVPLTAEEWQRQRAVYRNPRDHDPLSLGFATFYLNRCNRSGIIASGGMIGGTAQAGEWRLDARFNRAELAERIERIALYRERIKISNLDALDFLQQIANSPATARRAFVYLDPPYYHKGSQLYLNHYQPVDHARLAEFIRAQQSFEWLITYDNCPEIRALYEGLRQVPFDLQYTASLKRAAGKEVMILKPGLAFPSTWETAIPSEFLSSAKRLVIPASL